MKSGMFRRESGTVPDDLLHLTSLPYVPLSTRGGEVAKLGKSIEKNLTKSVAKLNCTVLCSIDIYSAILSNAGKE